MPLHIDRRENEEIYIADGTIVVKILSVRGDYVRVSIDAPREIAVDRPEIHFAKQRERQQATANTENN